MIYKINGKEVTPEKFRSHKMKLVPVGSRGFIRPAYSDTNPGSSMAMSVTSGDLETVKARLAKEGIVGVDYVPDKHGAKCVITNNSSRTGRRKWMKIFGEITGNGGLHDSESYD